MTLEDYLGNRYRITARLPAFTATHQRYVVQGTSGTPEQFVLSYCDYVKPLSPDALEKQKRVAGAMIAPAGGTALPRNRVEARAGVPVGRFRAARGPQPARGAPAPAILTMEEVEAFLRLLTEACEAAVALGWPKLSLETPNLFHDTRFGLPRIPAPDIPLFENAGTDTPEFDPHGDDPVQRDRFARRV